MSDGESDSGSAFNEEPYWCFLSYRHADNRKQDRDWASWLHRETERYDIPAELVGTKNLRGDTIPERIYPVFRDEESLSADADLANSIVNALDRSRFLVVLCSPRAVESTYVAQEIRHFKQTGKEDRIIAAILAGEPGHAKKECFPEPLRHPVRPDGSLDTSVVEEPIAADFRLRDGSEGYTSVEAYELALTNAPDGGPRKRELRKQVETYDVRLQLMKLKILAGILGVPLEKLRDRDKAYQLELARKRARTLRRWLGAVGMLAIVAAVAAWVANDQRKEANFQRNEAEERREEAEDAREAEAEQRGIAEEEKKNALHTLSLTDFHRASELLDEGRSDEALGYLARSLRNEPGNRLALQRSLNLLMQRNWPLPALAKRSEVSFEESERFAEIRPEFAVGNRNVGFDTTSPSSTTYGALPRYDRSGADLNIDLVRQNLDAFLRGEKPVSGWGETIPVAYSPDGRWIAIPGQSKLALFDRRSTAREPVAAAVHTNRILCVAFDPASRLIATGGYDNRVRIWDLHRQTLFMVSLPHQNWVNRVAFSTDGKWLMTLAEGTVRIWNLQDRRAREIVVHTGPNEVSSAVSWGGVRDRLRVAVGTSAGRLRVFDARDGKEILSEDLAAPILETFFSESGHRVFAVLPNVVIALEVDTARVIHRIGLPFEVTSVHRNFDHAGTRAVIGNDDGFGGLALLDLEVGTQAALASVPASIEVRVVQFADNGERLVVVSDDGLMRLLSGTDGKPLAEPFKFAEPDASRPTVVAVESGDGKVLALAMMSIKGEEHAMVRVWDVLNRVPVSSPTPQDKRGFPTLSIAAQAFSTSMEREAEIRELDGRSRFAIHEANYVGESAFSPDGSKVVTMPDRGGPVRIRDARSGRPFPIQLEGEVYLSSDGQSALTSTALWDIQTGRPLCDRFASAKIYARLAFGPKPGFLLATLNGLPREGMQTSRVVRLATAKDLVAPAWYPGFLEAVGGFRVNEAGTLEGVTNSRELFEKARAEATTECEVDKVVRWWFQPSPRGVNPFSGG